MREVPYALLNDISSHHKVKKFFGLYIDLLIRFLNESQWKPTKADESQWKPTKANENQWKPMKANENQWKPMKANESQWVNLDRLSSST